MNKSELIDAIAQATDLTKTDVSSVINAFTEEVTAALTKGDKVALPGFATFEVNKRPARTGRNPRTGEDIKIPAKNVVKIKPGKTLQDAVN